jgi:hypothetical protein
MNLYGADAERNRKIRLWWWFDQQNSTPASISLTPSSFSVAQGGTYQLTGLILDQHGKAISGQGPSYVSGTPSVATVSASGVVTGVASSGTTVITASYPGLTSKTSTGTATYTPVATSISLTPSTFNVSVGETYQLTGEILDQNSNNMPSLSPTYSSGTTANMTVNSSTGLVTGVNYTGTSTITASYASLTPATSTGACTYTPVATTVTLSPSTFNVPSLGTYQLTGAVLDQYGATIGGDTPTYSSGTTANITVNSSTGLCSGVATSSLTSAITASFSGATPATSTGTVVAPADIATLVTALGITPLAAFDARWAANTSTWTDAVNGLVATHSSAPTITGSATTAQVSFSSSQSSNTSASVAAPSTGVSIFMIGSLATASSGGPYATWTAPGTAIYEIGYSTSKYMAWTYHTSALDVLSTVNGGSTPLRAMAVSFSWAGAGTIRVDAQSQVTGTTYSGTPTGNGSLYLAQSQTGVVLQAVLFLPGLYTSAQFSTLASWGGTYHSFTAD